jgi:hypothetical protein
MKTIVVGGGAFLLTLGLSTYLGMQKAPADLSNPVPEVSADSAHAPSDSAHAPSDSAHAPADSVGEPHAPASEHPAPEASFASPDPLAGALPVTEDPTTTAPQDPPEKQVGRILAQMKPADAAGILTFLGDDEVARILCHLGVRQAAALLEQIPAERAATLTRSALRRGTKGCTS